MIADFTVTYVDGGLEAGATSPLSAVETERRYGTGVVPLLVEQSSMDALYWLMWRSLNPQADVDDDGLYLEWLSRVADFDVGDGDGRPN